MPSQIRHCAYSAGVTNAFPGPLVPAPPPGNFPQGTSLGEVQFAGAVPLSRKPAPFWGCRPLFLEGRPLVPPPFRPPGAGGGI